jgi:hypothetical protein
MFDGRCATMHRRRDGHGADWTPWRPEEGEGGGGTTLRIYDLIEARASESGSWVPGITVELAKMT